MEEELKRQVPSHVSESGAFRVCYFGSPLFTSNSLTLLKFSHRAYDAVDASKLFAALRTVAH